MTYLATAGRPAARVVHVVTGMMLGGAERQVEYLVRRSRHDASVICLYQEGPIADALRADGYLVTGLGVSGRSGRLAMVPRLARLLRAMRPDVVHLHLLSAQLFGVPAARLAGVPLVVSSEHSLMDDTIEGLPLTGRLRVMYRLAERGLAHTVAVSPTTRLRLLDWGVDDARISVIDNAIDFEGLAFDPERRSRLRADLGLPQGVVLVGAVGRLDPVKRFEPLIRSLAPLVRAGTHQLAVIGDGELRDHLRRLSEDLGVSRGVLLLGPRTDAGQLLNAMDVFVSPSRDETFGMAVVEAVANGLPTAYAQCPAIEDLNLRSDTLVPLAGSRRGDQEEIEIRTAVLQLGPPALARRDAGHPNDVPVQLSRRYGLDGQVSRVDDLYQHLLTTMHGTPQCGEAPESLRSPSLSRYVAPESGRAT